MGDLHAMFLKTDPQIRDVKEMDPSRVANREVLAHLLDLPEVQSLRQHSKNDRYGSAMAMLAVQDAVTESLTRAQSAAQEAEEKRQEAERQQQERADALAEALAQAEAGQGDPGDLQAKMDQFANTPAPDPSGVEKAAQQAAESAENAVRNAAQKATDDLDEEAAIMSAFGVEPGELQNMSAEERIALAQLVRGNRLAEFAKLIGQFKRVQRAESRRRVKDAASETHSLRTSNDLPRMVTAEWLNMADPILEELMWLRWLEHNLLTTDVHGRERQGQGPVIVVCDESSSMLATDVAGGSREAWSKALALALLDQARQRKRDFVYIGFSSLQNTPRVIEFPGGNSSIEKVLEMTEGFLGGGTHFEKPLMLALDHIVKRGDKPRPDIVFLTDDEYKEAKALPPEFLTKWFKVKDRMSIKCYGIQIGCAMSGSLEAVSDNVRSITSLVDSDPRAVGDLFRTI
jgi:uncharacterized protein with von Willebrand factor type A (vWA) domain